MKKFCVLPLQQLSRLFSSRAATAHAASSPPISPLTPQVTAEDLQSLEYHEEIMRRTQQNLAQLEAQLDLLLIRQTNPRNIH